MITKVMSSVVPKVVNSAPNGSGKLNKFLKSEALGKVLDVAAENPTLCNSGVALAICLGPRPIANYVVTEDKKDATYANCHSISSGGVGFVWPLIFATPIASGVKRIAANPAKYLKPELIQKFYPNVKVVEELAQDGKTMIKKIATNDKGQMLRKDGSILCQSLEPKMVYGENAQNEFRLAHPEVSVDKSGVVRSKTIFKTEDGVIKKDKNGNPIGVALQKDFTPITEEMEIGARKEQNVQKFINMVPDILLAPARASLTIAFIPPLLNAFGIEKSGKKAANTGGLNLMSYSNNTFATGKMAGPAMTFSAFKKGGV